MNFYFTMVTFILHEGSRNACICVVFTWSSEWHCQHLRYYTVGW